jgi:hypothetical protein
MYFTGRVLMTGEKELMETGKEEATGTSEK